MNFESDNIIWPVFFFGTRYATVKYIIVPKKKDSKISFDMNTNNIKFFY